jgi:hypothetical protein
MFQLDDVATFAALRFVGENFLLHYRQASADASRIG